MKITRLPNYQLRNYARPVVKGKTSSFLAAPAANLIHSFLPAPVFEPRPFLRLMAASAWRIAPDTHQDQASAQVRPRPGGMAAPEERWYPTASKRVSQNSGCRRAGSNLRMACGAGDPLSLQLVTAIRRPIQCRWLRPQSPYVARRIAVVPQAKRRVPSNGFSSFRM